MNRFLESLEDIQLDGDAKQAVGKIYRAIQSPEYDDLDIEKEASEPPSLVEFETLGSNTPGVTVSDDGLKITQTLPDGTEIITVQ